MRGAEKARVVSGACPAERDVGSDHAVVLVEHFDHGRLHEIEASFAESTADDDRVGYEVGRGVDQSDADPSGGRRGYQPRPMRYSSVGAPVMKPRPVASRTSAWPEATLSQHP